MSRRWQERVRPVRQIVNLLPALNWFLDSEGSTKMPQGDVSIVALALPPGKEIQPTLTGGLDVTRGHFPV